MPRCSLCNLTRKCPTKLIGQLFIAIVVARLVAAELAGRDRKAD